MSRPASSVPDLKLVRDGDPSAPGGGGASWLSNRTSRRRSRPSRRALVGSLAIHATLLAGVIAAGITRRPDLPEMIVYRVDLVSPPAQELGEPEPPVAPPQRQVVQDQPPPATPPPPRPTPPPPPPVRTEPPRQQPPPETPPTPPRSQTPDPTTRVAGENLTVRLDGEEFPFPEYLENIIRQINRYFRWSGTPGLSAEVYFLIRRDGSVEDIRILRGSGNIGFNFEAMGAIEQAGSRHAFGPLPDDYRADMLPVAFEFLPQRE
jgi:outer membrane biosynthesis protein TonB